MYTPTQAFVALATFGTYTSLGNRLSLEIALPGKNFKQSAR